jgi:hypothetical protein
MQQQSFAPIQPHTALGKTKSTSSSQGVARKLQSSGALDEGTTHANRMHKASTISHTVRPQPASTRFELCLLHLFDRFLKSCKPLLGILGTVKIKECGHQVSHAAPIHLIDAQHSSSLLTIMYCADECRSGVTLDLLHKVVLTV